MIWFAEGDASTGGYRAEASNHSPITPSGYEEIMILDPGI